MIKKKPNYSDFRSIFDEKARLKFLLQGAGGKMEAKDQNTIWMKNELDFFDLIEKKLEEQGFEVLETSLPNRMTSDKLSSERTEGTLKTVYANRSTGRFAY
jgi:hypothetical protein